MVDWENLTRHPILTVKRIRSGDERSPEPRLAGRDGVGWLFYIVDHGDGFKQLRRRGGLSHQMNAKRLLNESDSIRTV